MLPFPLLGFQLENSSEDVQLQPIWNAQSAGVLESV